MRSQHYLANGRSLKLDSSLCTGCAACIEVCPHAVFATGPRPGRDGAGPGQDAWAGSASIALIVDREACMECGACAKNCPFGALSVDSGVGCAQAIILGKLRGSAPECGCSGSSSCC